MTKRLAGFVVVLGADMREDDAQAVLNAIKTLKHVQTVEPIEADMMQQMAEIRVRADLIDKLLAVLR